MSANISEELYSSGIGKVRYFLIILGVVVFFILGGFLYWTSAHVLLPPAEKVLIIPKAERQFIKIIGQYSESYVRAPNKSGYLAGHANNFPLRMKRRQEIKSFVSEYAVKKWVGTLKYKQQNEKGEFYFAVALGPIIELAPQSLRPSANSAHTLITKDSPLHNQISELEVGDTVIFSGTFYPSELDYFKEISDNGFDVMAKPCFAFKFVSLEKNMKSS